MKTDVEEALEWTTGLTILCFSRLSHLEFAICLLNPSECLVQVKFLQRATSNEETRGVSGSPVGEAMLDPVSLEFVGVGGAEDFITRDLGGNNLKDNVAVGEADN
jgi:hypothetical protein